MDTANLQPVAGRKMLLALKSGEQGPAEWIQANKDAIERFLSVNGALLIRGLEIGSDELFGNILTLLFGEKLASYTYRSTPRTALKNNVYTATEYHASETIPQHNENSYSNVWPTRIGFLCMVPAAKRGNTPISDSRVAYERVPKEIRDEFERKKVMYIRNYSTVDLPWQEVFQTNDRREVERYCGSNDIQFEWTPNGLRTKQVSQAVAVHPVTGEKLWFNQAHLFHPSNLDKELREDLLSLLGKENMPRNACFGDGTSIDPEFLSVIRNIYETSKSSFQWEKGDLLLLDNMLFTHGREPFEGRRKVLVGMAKNLSTSLS